jgi:hypothetical protein
MRIRLRFAVALVACCFSQLVPANDGIVTDQTAAEAGALYTPTGLSHWLAIPVAGFVSCVLGSRLMFTAIEAMWTQRLKELRPDRSMVVSAQSVQVVVVGRSVHAPHASSFLRAVTQGNPIAVSLKPRKVAEHVN